MSNVDWFITLSKYNRGSLTDEEIKTVVEIFKGPKQLKFNKVYLINEHKNKKGEIFEHLHIYIQLETFKRSDNLRNIIKKMIPFIEHNKDLDIRQAVDVSTLIAGYMTKTDDFNLLYSFGITEEELKSHEINKKIKIDFIKEKMKVKKERIYKGDLPYIIYEYILEQNINYDCSLTLFSYVIKKMIKENFDFELRGLVEVKGKLDLLFDNKLSEQTIDCYIMDQFKNLSFTAGNSDLYIIRDSQFIYELNEYKD